MNSRLFLIPAILATTAALGVSGDALSAPPDAQAQAAALLSGSQTSGSQNTREQAPAHSSPLAGVDAHARAAALLSGVHIGQESNTSVSVTTSSAVALDAHARAAALLRGSRINRDENPRVSATRETAGQHPAVLVAQKWSTRGIDPNTFIVAHPARLQLIAASQTGKDSIGDAQGTGSLASASTQVTSPGFARGLPIEESSQ